MEEMRKYSENHVESLAVTDDGIDLVLHHVLPRKDLPDIAQTVLKKDLVITRKEKYTSFGEPVTGTYEASIPGGPGSLTGTMELFSTDTGCTLRTTSEAKVFIPFVGGKLEQLMLVNWSTCSAPRPRSPRPGSLGSSRRARRENPSASSPRHHRHQPVASQRPLARPQSGRHAHAARRPRPAVVDLGYGAMPVTTLEMAARLRTVRSDVRVVGLEIDPARVVEGRDGVTFARGGFELAGLRPTLIRAFNVLRQYPEDAVDDAWGRLRSGLAPGGLIVDGTCDELGRRCAWVLLDRDGPPLTDPRVGPVRRRSPQRHRERLPKALIHRNVGASGSTTYSSPPTGRGRRPRGWRRSARASGGGKPCVCCPISACPSHRSGGGSGLRRHRAVELRPPRRVSGSTGTPPARARCARRPAAAVRCTRPVASRGRSGRSRRRRRRPRRTGPGRCRRSRDPGRAQRRGDAERPHHLVVLGTQFPAVQREPAGRCGRRGLVDRCTKLGAGARGRAVRPRSGGRRRRRPRTTHTTWRTLRDRCVGTRPGEQIPFDTQPGPLGQAAADVLGGTAEAQRLPVVKYPACRSARRRRSSPVSGVGSRRGSVQPAMQ